MFSLSFALLAIAAIVLLALSHVEATFITPAEIEKYSKEYADRVFEPTKAYYSCRSTCYNDGLKAILAPDNTPFPEKMVVLKDVAAIDLCVATKIASFTSFNDIVEYEKNRGVLEITVSQYCVDKVLNKGKPLFGSGKGKLSLAQALGVQAKLLACSVKNCDPDYSNALIAAFSDQ